jgi:5-methylcytosine-specific restriction endonuclease McrA
MKDQIKELRNKGLTYSQIGEKLDISRQRVHQIIKNYRSLSTKDSRRFIFNKNCRNCGDIAKCIHHKDRNSRNNKPANLIPLCRNCHIRVHTKTNLEMEQKIKELWNKGFMPSEIIKKLKVTKGVIYRVRDKFNLEDLY